MTRMPSASVRGMEGWKEAGIRPGGTHDLKVAVASGLSAMPEDCWRPSGRAKVSYDHLLEIMACPGGCAGGGGSFSRSTTVMSMAEASV